MWPWDVNVGIEPREPQQPLSLGRRMLDRLARRCQWKSGPGVPPRLDAAGRYRPLFGIHGIEESSAYQVIRRHGSALGFSRERIVRRALWLRMRLFRRASESLGMPSPSGLAPPGGHHRTETDAMPVPPRRPGVHLGRVARRMTSRPVRVARRDGCPR